MSFRASVLIRWIFRGWLCVALAGGAGAREIYVSPEGDDANPGTRELPWKTLDQVSSEAGPGDTFLFLPGEYSGRLIPARSGCPERPIVFRAVEPRRAVWYAPSGSGAVIELRGLQHISQNAFFNNIVAGNDRTGGGIQLWVVTDISRDNRFLNNLLHGSSPDQHVVRYGREYYAAAQLDRRTRVHQGFWTEFGDNRDAAPRFRDADNRDYRLQAGCPAIDAGRPLAIAIGEGSGTVLPVSDGVAFYDGFGIAGEQGDWIAVGRPDQLARIERIELRYYQAALLYLDREVQWTDGAPVSLPWAGQAPDAGAFEYGLVHPRRVEILTRPSSVQPGESVRFTLDTHGQDASSVVWDFGDGGTSTDPQPSHTYEQSARHGVTAQVRLANGEQVTAVALVKVGLPAEASRPLVEADFEHETRWDWGYHFKFYRNDQTDWNFVAGAGDQDSRGVHLRAAPERKTNVNTCKIAPGAWALDQHPIIRFAYRIPPGVPVAIVVEPFSAPGLPRGFVLGGTENHPVGPYQHLDQYRLIDDGQWHTIHVDARTVRQAVPDLQYLRCFLLYLQWGRDADPQYEFWFDDFAIEKNSP